MTTKQIMIKGIVALICLLILGYVAYFFIWPAAMINSNFALEYEKLHDKIFRSNEISLTYRFRENNYCIDSNMNSYFASIKDGKILLDEVDTFIIFNNTTLYHIEEHLVFVGVHDESI